MDKEIASAIAALLRSRGYSVQVNEQQGSLPIRFVVHYWKKPGKPMKQILGITTVSDLRWLIERTVK